MFRSEFANQRIVAMRMLSGILLRRDCAVAMEAYSEAFLADSTEEDADPLRWCAVEDELGRRSNLLGELSRCFEDLLHRATLLLCSSTAPDGSGGGLDFVPAAAAVRTDAACAPPGLTWEHTRQLRKLLCWCALHLLCASDLPVELPTLLLWALSSNINASAANNNGSQGVDDGSDCGNDFQLLAPSFGQAAPRNNPAVAKLGLLRCLYMYLCSPAEEASVDWLRRRSTLWSAYGTPRLAAPHTRRSGAVSYEQDMADSLVRATKFLSEEDEEQQDEEEEGNQQRARERTPDSVAEAFALQCRWSRISAMVSRGSIVALLANHAITAVDALLDAASDKKSFSSSSSGDVITALGMASLQLLTRIARQGNEDVLPVMTKQFLRPSWKAFVMMSDSGHVRLPGSDLHALYQRWWQVLAELVVRDRAVAVFLFETHAGWTDPMVLGILLQNLSVGEEEHQTEAQGTAECLSSIVLRVVKSSLVFGLGFRCVTELLLADQVSATAAAASAGSSFTNLLTLLEQAAVSASAILSSTERNIATSGDGASSQVPFALPKALEDVTQASSSIFAFVKRQWSRLQSTVMGPTQEVGTKSVILSLLSAVFSGARDQTSSTAFDWHFESLESLCRLRMAESFGEATSNLRGCGLVRSAVQFNAQLLAQEQQKAGGGSVTAAMLHLSGQGRDLTRFAATQELFNPVISCKLIADQVAVGGQSRRGSVQWLLSREFLLSLLRHLTCAIDLLEACSSLLDGSTVEALVQSADRCCVALETPFTLFATAGESTGMVEPTRVVARAASGSVGEGVLMWHYQRIQQAGLILQVTGAAALLRKLSGEAPAAGRLGAALDGLLASHLHSLTANSHSSILIALFRAYLRRLVCASQGHDEALSLSDLYDANAARYEPLCALVTARAFGCDLERVDAAAQGGISGTILCRTASTWLTLKGTEGAAIALKPNWAYDVLLADVAGDQLADWLQVLLAQQTMLASSSASQPLTALEQDGAVLASQIYSLLKLSVSDQAQKWAIDTEGEKAGGILESNQHAVHVYRTLLMQLIGSTHKHKQHSTSFTTAFCQTVSKEYFATTGMMSAHRHKARAARSGPAKYANLEGVLDLCEKALDAGLNQVIDEQLHAMVLVVLSSPLLPWAVRHRVWSQLAPLRLVHLLEDGPALLSLLPVLLPFLRSPSSNPCDRCGPLSSESTSLYMEIIGGLSDLRSVDDRSWAITAVCIMQMTHYVFAGTSVYSSGAHGGSINNKVSGQRAELLLHLLELRNAGCETGWIADAVLRHAASMHAKSSHAGELGPSQLEVFLDEVRSTCGAPIGDQLSLFSNDLQVESGDEKFQRLHDLIFV